MSRPARALLSAESLRHNLDQVRRHAPRAKVMAVVKANGYGHGADWVARGLTGADGFGVASLDEALGLRAALGADRRPICLLEGVFSGDEIAVAAAEGFELVVHHEEQIKLLAANKPAKELSVWLKIDTGMHRLGFAPERTTAAIAQIKKLSFVSQLRLMSHLANADDPADSATQRQIDSFKRFVDGAAEASLANSAGVVAWPGSHFDWVRPGIMLYGGSPVIGAPAEKFQLRPVMTLETALIAVQRRTKGEAIGYGGAYVCPEDMTVGVAAIGYGDGYPRHARGGTPVLVNGRRVDLIGRVSMDMIALDLRSQPQAKPGDRVVLWGEGLPIDEVAEHADTISYELMCQVTERIPRMAVSGE